MKLINKSLFLALMGGLFFLVSLQTKAACSYKASFKGDSLVCSGSTINYVSPTTSGHYYRWVVKGGTISSGGTSASVFVLWSDPGSFSIKLIDSTSTCLDSLRKPIKVGLSSATLHNASYVTLGANASVSGKVYTVTTASGNEYDAVWNKYSINLNRNFDFTFKTNQNGAADGMVFVLQNSGLNSITTASSTAGGTYLGYYDQPSGSCDQSIGVELDIYNGGTSATGGYDSSASHISLVKNKSFTPIRKQVDITSPSTLGSGSNHKLRVTWNRDINLFEVYMDGNKTHSWSNDIVKNIFKGNPIVYFGFTGATGGSTAVQTFTNDTLIYGFPTIITGTSSDTFCAGDSLTLIASGSMMNYLWSTGAKTRAIKVGKAGTYSVTTTDSTLCSFASVSHTVYTTSTKATAGFSVSNVCQGQGLTLTNSSTPTSGVSYLWKFSSTDSSTSKTPSYQYNAPGTYNITLGARIGGCTDKMTKSVTIYNAPLGSNLIKGSLFKGQFSPANAPSSTDFICLGDTNVYEVLPPKNLANSDYGTKWIIKNVSFATAYGNSIKDTATKIPASGKNATFSFYPKSYGDSVFILKVTLRTLGGNCDSTLVRYIKARPKAVAGFTVSNVCQGVGLTLTNTTTPSSGVTYVWRFSSTDSSIVRTPIYQYYVPGTYTVSLKVNNGGCVDITSKAVTLFNSPLGSNLVKGSPFNGQFNNGDPVNPDYVCLNDTNVYQILAPKGVTNGDYGTKWIIKALTFTTGGGTSIKDTATKLPTSGKNATFSFFPKSNGDSIYNLKIVLRTLPGGCDSILYRTIKVRFKPTAKFGFTNGCQGPGVSFKDSSTQKGLTGISNWAWSFGDTKTSNAQNPTHNYAAAGTYKVTLTASNDGGCSNSISKTVEEYPLPKPKISLSLACNNSPTAFVDSSTIASGTVTGWAWSFGDASAKATTQNPAHSYIKSGPYNVKLVAVSNHGCKDSVTKLIRVQPKPKAIFTYPKDECVGSNYYFANTSTDSTNANLNKWDFGDGITSAAATGIHAFTKNGSYQVKLTVTSKAGCFDTIVKTVVPLSKPTVNFFFGAACTGKTVSFIDSGKNGTKALYTWNYGDGSTPDQFKTNTTSHIFKKAGSYNVTLTINPDAGCSDSQKRSIIISDVPKAAFTAPDVCKGTQTVFTDASTTAAGSTYKWEFGDGGTATTQNTTHKYATVGSYNVKLTVTNPNGCTDSVRTTVNVVPLPVVGKFTASVHNSTARFTPADSTQKTYKWLFGTGDSSSSTKPTYTYATPGTYQVKLFVTNSAGCTASVSDSVTVGKVGIAYIIKSKNNLVVYPNPFEGSTNISYTLSEKSQVNISVFDMQGKLVAKIKEGHYEAGSYTDQFDAAKYHAMGGVYLLKMVVNGQVSTTQIVNTK